MARTGFFRVVADDFIVFGEVGRQLALEAGGFLRPELPPLLLCICGTGLQPVELVLQPIGNLFLVFCECWLLLDASRGRLLGPIGGRGAMTRRQIWGRDSGFRGCWRRRWCLFRLVGRLPREACMEQRPRRDLDRNSRGEPGLLGDDAVEVAVGSVQLALRRAGCIAVLRVRKQAMPVMCVGDLGIRQMQTVCPSRAGH